jgi:hypothetical protein
MSRLDAPTVWRSVKTEHGFSTYVKPPPRKEKAVASSGTRVGTPGIGIHKIAYFHCRFHHLTWVGQKQGCCCLVQTIVFSER